MDLFTGHLKEVVAWLLEAHKDEGAAAESICHHGEAVIVERG